MRPFSLVGMVLLIVASLEARTITIHKSSDTQALSQPITQSEKPLTLALLSAPKLIGKYTPSLYNVSMATLLARHIDHCRLIRYDMEDESSVSLNKALERMTHDGVDAILAPLTAEGAKQLLTLSTPLPVFIPTVHKRELPSAPENFVFGGIDYVAQIEALYPHMSGSIAIFYDASPVGNQLKTATESVFLSHKGDQKKVLSFPVDFKGENIVTHLSKKPSSLNKSSIILHIPVVKSAILAAHLTFVGIKERNILSTQINLDPTLHTLTHYNDRKNMIVANSLIEFPPSIYETNALMSNDIAADWILYAASVGIDYLISRWDGSPREYPMRIVHSQVIYPIELLRAKEFGFEPLTQR
jgi:hypothetical protein